MDEPRVFEADVHERAEVDHVENGALKFHPRREVFELEDPLLEDGLWQVVARVTLRAGQGVEDVTERRLADRQFLRQGGNIGFGEFLVQLIPSVSGNDDVGAELKLLEKLGSSLVAFRVDPGPVERVGAFADLQEAGRLREGGRSDPFNQRDLRPFGERPVLFPVVGDALGGELVQTRHVPQERDTRRVEIHTDKVHATGDDRVQRLTKLLRVHVVLIESHPNRLGLDLDEFREWILEPSTDRDRATEGSVELGELFATDRAC